MFVYVKVVRSAIELRAAILTAARIEFARSGLSGARVDRIARAARASKERLYVHFGDKESLFREVVAIDAAEFALALDLREESVAEFAGIAFDFASNRPEHVRMISWARLENGVQLGELTPLAAHMRHAAEVIGRAQSRGLVDPVWDPFDLLGILMSIALSWVSWPGPVEGAGDPTRTALRRAGAVEAARRILTPCPDGGV